MQIRLEGHDCRYAVEQSLLSWLPEQKWSYGEAAPGEDSLLSAFYAEERPARALALLRLGGRETMGEARSEEPLSPDPLLRDRNMQRLIKTALFRAVTALTGQKPPWGALTGVRPAKLSARLLESCHGDAAQAAAAMEAEYDVSPARAALCVQAGQVSRNMRAALEPQDAVLYVGVPFCPSRCAYCSFVSHSVEKSLALVEPYVDALCREIEGLRRLPQTAGLRLRAFYMGGGTPTTLSAAQLERVLGLLRRSFDWSACAEWTVEAGRPDTISRETLQVLADCGVTRISINPQSMEETVLAAIGRRHSAADVEACYALARQVFPGQINMDLIAGLPADTEEGFARSLEALLALRPENITVHSLTRKRGANLNSGDAAPKGGWQYPSDAAVGQMLETARARLSAAGFSPYYLYRQKFSAGGFENVGWSQPGAECLYNVCMMEELCHVLSLGAGGATKRVFPESGKIRRCFNKKYPYEYNLSVDSAVSDKYLLFDL